MKGLSGSFPTNPYNKPPYWLSVGIGAAYIMRPSWSLFCYKTGIDKYKIKSKYIIPWETKLKVIILLLNK